MWKRCPHLVKMQERIDLGQNSHMNPPLISGSHIFVEAWGQETTISPAAGARCACQFPTCYTRKSGRRKAKRDRSWESENSTKKFTSDIWVPTFLFPTYNLHGLACFFRTKTHVPNPACPGVCLASPKICLKISHVMSQQKGRTPLRFLYVHNSHVMCVSKQTIGRVNR